MRVFVIGGTGFIGSQVVRRLAAQGHPVTVLHRGKRAPELPPTVTHLVGDRAGLVRLSAGIQADVVIDLICTTAREGRELIEAFEGGAARSVVISSADVYRAYDVLHRKDDGPLQPVPIAEDADLRRSRYPYRGMHLGAYDWVSEDSDKILAEEAVSRSARFPATILRLPMIYGPGDPLRRFRPYLKQMDDGATAIPLDDSAAAWVGCWGYVENVAEAIVLAATDDRAAGRIYNVADGDDLSYAGWLEELGGAAGWKGKILPTPKDRLPPELVVPYNPAQNWNLDTTRIRRELGFREPVARREALDRTIAWERTVSEPRP